MIVTLPVTILVEGVVVVCYCIWQSKPLLPVLITSAIANIITQLILWIVLNIFFQYYLAALLISEVLIWLLESFLLFISPKNQLTFRNAVLLSLSMNVVSFGIGWLLPV